MSILSPIYRYLSRSITPAHVRLWLLHALAWCGRWWVRTHDPGHRPRRILIIKPDHLGDVLLATPALHVLRRRYPDADLVMLVGPWSAFLLARNPDLTTTITLPFPGFARGGSKRSRFWPYLLLLYYALLLRAGRFDAALLLRDDHWWGAVLALLAGIPLRIGYAVPECAPFLTRALPWEPQQHVTRQALDLVDCLPGQEREPARWQKATAPTLYFKPAPAESAWAEDWLRQQGIRADETLVILHPGTGGAAKLWPPERWAAVLNQLAAEQTMQPLRLLLTGGTGEAHLVQAVAQLLHAPPLTLVGATSVGQLAALLGRANLVLGVDSGPLHLAVSQGTPSIHLFGPSDAGRFAPWGDKNRHIVLQSDLWCRPCGVFAACPRGTDPPECMQQLTVAQVVQTARRLLAS